MLNEGEIHLVFRNNSDPETLEALRRAALSGETITVACPVRVVSVTKRPMDYAGLSANETIFELKVAGRVRSEDPEAAELRGYSLDQLVMWHDEYKAQATRLRAALEAIRAFGPAEPVGTGPTAWDIAAAALK